MSNDTDVLVLRSQLYEAKNKVAELERYQDIAIRRSALLQRAWATFRDRQDLTYSEKLLMHEIRKELDRRG